jgi:hypothetical protein
LSSCAHGRPVARIVMAYVKDRKAMPRAFRSSKETTGDFLHVNTCRDAEAPAVQQSRANLFHDRRRPVSRRLARGCITGRAAMARRQAPHPPAVPRSDHTWTVVWSLEGEHLSLIPYCLRTALGVAEEKRAVRYVSARAPPPAAARRERPGGTTTTFTVLAETTTMGTVKADGE